MNYSKSIAKWPYIFLSPYIITYVAFGLFPLVFTLYISFTNWNGIGKKSFVGFKNYIKLFTDDPLFFKTLGNTFIIMAVFLPLLLIIPLLLANLLHSKHIRFSRFFQLANFLPYITTPVATALIFYMIFDLRTGLVNMSLMKLNQIQEEIPFLQDAWLARLTLVILIFWKQVGYYMVIYLAGLSSIPLELYEAAEIDGANRIQAFFHITIPSIRSTIVFLLLTGVIWSLQLVEEPMVLFSSWGNSSGLGGSPDYATVTTVWYMYDTSFGSNSQYGKGSAIAYSLFFIVLLLTMLAMKLTRRKGDFV